MLQTIEYYNVKSKFVHENAIFDSKTSTITLYEGEEVVAILKRGMEALMELASRKAIDLQITNLNTVKEN